MRHLYTKEPRKNTGSRLSLFAETGWPTALVDAAGLLSRGLEFGVSGFGSGD